MLWEGEHRNSFPKSLASPQMPAQPAAMRSFLAISCFGVLWAAPPSVHESQSRSLNSLVLLTEKSFPFLTNRFQGMEVRGCECAHQMMAGATHWGSVPTDPRLSSQLCQELAGGHGRTQLAGGRPPSCCVLTRSGLPSSFCEGAGPVPSGAAPMTSFTLITSLEAPILIPSCWGEGGDM